MSAFAARAPGRINLIGEHTDYNLGFALPIALERCTTVRFEPDGSDSVTVSSDRESNSVSFPIDVRPGDVRTGDVNGWSAYPAGALWALADAGHPVVGGVMSVTSDVPVGAGLSSSAALECAALLAMNAATGTELDRSETARIAQHGENDFVGVPTGLMDQLASMYGEADRALLVDFESTSVRHVPFDLAAHGLTLLVVDSHAVHQHTAGEYASRRAACTRAARVLGVGSLRDVQGREVLDEIEGVVDRRRVRHVLSENQRVLDCAEALAASDFPRVGQLMIRSHESMRKDFEITTPHIDLIAASAVRHGALGARMTGGGFGGCVIAIVPASEIDAITDSITGDTTAGGFPSPTIFTARAGRGASRM
ncbi:galactokinase [Rhodococcoides yunnanense]|uniref:galactokinase n=1 Tax=Rhodococcoides yunnanense TaxID=278209 RepID=UPI0022B08945|nr:galactokinase [Rhodococcus yunnanensis]MCZ4278109.1 galactokinase [Rhodococcus yunnanensis]